LGDYGYCLSLCDDCLWTNCVSVSGQWKLAEECPRSGRRLGANYFNSRPSTTSYSTANPKKDDAGVLKTGVSGASNLAPSNPALIDRIKGKNDPDPKKATEGDIPRYTKAGVKPTADLVYTSGSSLDPHIIPEGAITQIQRVAKVRNLQPKQLEDLIGQNTEGRFLGIFGEPGVNVLKLNLALDRMQTKP
jgi:potassium-transporting ATPase KdpC subunit